MHLKRNSTITVNLTTIQSNLEALRQYLKPGVKQMAVVKADAYGHGAVEVARYLADAVDWFAVDDVDEGIELRENGIDVPILVFGVPEKATADRYQTYNLTATISATAHFDLLPAGTAYHLNFNTGMGRLGFRPEQAAVVARLQQDHPELQCTGIYSHFATADEQDREKCARQFELFEDVRAHFDAQLLTHFCNTAGLAWFDKAQFDMVRTGIGLYGYAPGELVIKGLQPAMQWHTRLGQVNAIKKGETTSYGATWEAPEDGYIGVIPVGYSDGVPRLLSGKFSVTINGEQYPSVGTVTMNYCMIYLGNSPLEAGTKVELWNARHHAGHWAAASQTIPYERLTSVLNKIPRIYIKS